MSRNGNCRWFLDLTASQCCLCDITQLAALPRLHNTTFWKRNASSSAVTSLFSVGMSCENHLLSVADQPLLSERFTNWAPQFIYIHNYIHLFLHKNDLTQFWIYFNTAFFNTIFMYFYTTFLYFFLTISYFSLHLDIFLHIFYVCLHYMCLFLHFICPKVSTASSEAIHHINFLSKPNPPWCIGSQQVLMDLGWVTML